LFKKLFERLKLASRIAKDTYPSDEQELRDQMRIVQEQKKRTTHNFGNAGGLNWLTDFNRGFGGRAVDDHLNRSPKDNP